MNTCSVFICLLLIVSFHKSALAGYFQITYEDSAVAILADGSDLTTASINANDPYQQWSLDPSGLVVNYAFSKVLDVAGNGTDPKTPVTVWPVDGGLNQLWSFTTNADGTVVIISRASGLFFKPFSGYYVIGQFSFNFTIINIVAPTMAAGTATAPAATATVAPTKTTAAPATATAPSATATTSRRVTATAPPATVTAPPATATSLPTTLHAATATPPLPSLFPIIFKNQSKFISSLAPGYFLETYTAEPISFTTTLFNSRGNVFSNSQVAKANNGSALKLFPCAALGNIPHLHQVADYYASQSYQVITFYPPYPTAVGAYIFSDDGFCKFAAGDTITVTITSIGGAKTTVRAVAGADLAHTFLGVAVGSYIASVNVSGTSSFGYLSVADFIEGYYVAKI